jgi:hypothetical protein
MDPDPDPAIFFIDLKDKDLVFAYYFLEVRGASKIKVKNVNKKRMATARRLIFFGISQGIHC